MDQKIKQDFSIGYNLRRLRDAKGWTQDELAAKLQVKGLDVSRSMISQMEGGTYNIRISILATLKKLYNVSYDEFFKGL